MSGKPAPKWSRGTAAHKNEFHPPFQRDLGRPDCAAKIYPLLISPKSASIFAPSRLMKRGVRVVTIRGVRVAVDAMALRARGIAGRSQALSWGCERLIRAGRAALFAYGKSVWFWHPWLVSSWRRLFEIQPGSLGRQSGSDGGKRNSSPGRARHKPSNHCAGKAGCSPLDLYARVRTSLCTLHTRPRVQRAPGLPCALSRWRGTRDHPQLGRFAPRDRGFMCPALSKMATQRTGDANTARKKPGRNGRAFLLSKYQIAEVSDRERISARPG